MRVPEPPKADAPGHLKGHHKTSDPAERLLADSRILTLARGVLPVESYRQAEHLSQMLAGSKAEQKRARLELMRLVQPPPKRPLYYCQHEVQFLPRWTRNALRYLGDFLDEMVKHAAFGKEQDQSIFRNSLGPAIERFAKCFPGEITRSDWLRDYNGVLYRDAKHDMNLPLDRSEHRFTSREVVLCLFVTMRLADRISALSPTAADYRADVRP